MGKKLTPPNEFYLEGLADVLLDWFDKNQRPLPWRKAHNPYAPYDIWISEIMLQQTQMERGVVYFLRWKERFPDIEAVAKASEEDILQAWEGLGYYSRARNLHKAAKIMVADFGGKVPQNVDDLASLPGIGPYTIAAILSIAYEQDILTVDANVERIFSRICNMETTNLKKPVHEEVSRIFPKGKARYFNQACMEFGALVCSKPPQCPVCPIIDFCKAKKLGLERERPVLAKKAPIIAVNAVFIMLFDAEKGYLLRKRPNKGLWANMWEFLGADDIEQTKVGQAKAKQVKIGQARVSSHDMEKYAQSFFDQEDILQEQIRLQSGSSLQASLHFLGNVKHSYTNHRLKAWYYVVSIANSTGIANGSSSDTAIKKTREGLAGSRTESLAGNMAENLAKSCTEKNTEKLPENCAWVQKIEDVALSSHHRRAVDMYESFMKKP